MKKREFIIANTILVCLAFLFLMITFNIFSKQSFNSIIQNEVGKIINRKDISDSQAVANCSVKQPLDIIPSNDEHLIKLSEYQTICKSFATDSLMFFTSFPYDEESAILKAEEISNKLKNFHLNKISPIVIVEPYVGDNEMEYRDFINGVYDTFLDRYFAKMLESGVTSEMMGTWVPFPESNTPNWANKDTEPNDFSIVVNKYFGFLQKYYPSVKGSILLSAITYEPDDLGWDNGDYINLAAYLANIDKSYIGSLGIQGFPWVSDATRSEVEILRASEFLQPDITISAAQELRTRDIWINTGSFYSKYTNDPDRRVFLSLNDRKSVLEGILDTAIYIKTYQLNEYRVRINLFSEDKSETPEATDWSYFQSIDSTNLLKDFLSRAEEGDIKVSIFDR